MSDLVGTQIVGVLMQRLISEYQRLSTGRNCVWPQQHSGPDTTYMGDIRPTNTSNQTTYKGCK